ncbi:hypothetical protein AC1031_008672 [Aphanomyces cochlioides]|nr:hypothetical protein AC1031_008672 [Aphanomyces cochlioides]
MRAAEPVERLPTMEKDAVEVEKRFEDASTFEQRHVSDQLRLCAMALSVAAFFLFLYIDLCPQDSVTAFALGTLMIAWTGPLTVLAGTQLPTGQFKVWQPFEGGFYFVSMQAVGWCLTGLLLASCVVYLFNYHMLLLFDGQFLLIGIIGFIAQMVLNVSIDHFVANAPVPIRMSLPMHNTKALVAVLLSISGCLFFIAFDGLVRSSVVLTLGAILFTASSMVLHVGIGVFQVPGYVLWQPFVGGNVFMLLQYLGWKFYGCTLVSAALLSNADFYSGTASCMGILGLISQLLLLVSLSFFHVGPVTSSPKNRVPEEAFVSGIILLMTALITFCLYYGVVPETSTTAIRLLGILALLFLGAASPLVHIGGYRSIQGYCLWQPFVGESMFVFIQSVGWTWYGIFFGVALLIVLNDSFLVQLLPLACLLGTASCIAIAFSVPFFCAPRIATLSNPPSLGSLELLLSLLLSSCSVVLHLVVEVLQLKGLVATLCIAFGLLLAALSMIITHGSGRRHYPSYHIWQPFVGGNAFVLRQALGWTFFAVFALFDFVCMASIRSSEWAMLPGFVLAVGLFIFVPHWILASSLQLFQENAVAAIPKTGWTAFRVTVPILANFFLTLGSLILFGAAEWCRPWWSLTKLFFVFGTVGAVVSVACTHCLCGPHMHEHYRLFQPFRGGLRFVVLQGAAWSLASIAWMAACSVLYWPTQFFTIDGLITAIGAMFLAAQTLLYIGLYCFDNLPHRPQSVQPSKPNLVLGIMVGIVACCLFSIVDMVLFRYRPAVPAFPATACAILALFVSMPYVFHMKGRVIYRVCGCALWSLTVVLGAVFTYDLWCEEGATQSQHKVFQFQGVFTGSIGLVAHLVLLFSVSSDASVNDHGKILTPVGLGGVLIGVGLQFQYTEHFVSSLLEPTKVVAVVGGLCFYLASVIIYHLLHPITPVELQPLDMDEALVDHIASFLRPRDMAALAAASKRHRALVSQSIWHNMFLRMKLAASAGQMPSLPAVQQTKLFSDTWCQSLERSLLALVNPQDINQLQCTPPPADLKWSHIAQLVDRGGSLFHCELCSTYSVFTASQQAWETRYACSDHAISTWVASPCSCRHAITHEPKMAHRMCLEKNPRSICAIHRRLKRVPRAPVSVPEIIASCLNRFQISNTVIVAIGVAFVFCPTTLAVWIIGSILLGGVVCSREFDRAVTLIWNDPNAFPLYLRIYYTTALSSVALLGIPLWSDPSPFLRWGLCAWFATIVAIVTFMFWKASLAIATYTSASSAKTPQPSLSDRCALCRLHVCHTQ